MKLSFNYQDLLKELDEEIRDGTLKPSDDILIVRSEDPISSKMDPTFRQIADQQGLDTSYRPIVDWYYDDIMTDEDLRADPTDTPEEAEEKKAEYAAFMKDRERMAQIKVADAIAEMKEWSRIA